jgi:hypothetical protein
VRRALLDGLATLAPVAGEWNLVWGPATTRDRGDLFDSAAMYVVRSRPEPARHVVVIRGTNPISISDWLWGDFWVWKTAPWPGDPTGAAQVSMSTARGLHQLQAMRSGRMMLPPAKDPARPAPSQAALDALTSRLADFWKLLARDPFAWLADKVAQLTAAVAPAPVPAGAGLDLVALLRAEGALDVTVTGHSKGGALASTVALWLKDALASADPAEHWDGRRGARVACYAFAAPTPGNGAFAKRVDRVLAGHHHHLRNTNDVVTLAWQADELARIPELYAPRRTVLEPLIPVIVSRVGGLDYRQARSGVTAFVGTLDPERPFAAEFVHQHLDAYLAELGLLDEGLNALTFFF